MFKFIQNRKIKIIFSKKKKIKKKLFSYRKGIVLVLCLIILSKKLKFEAIPYFFKTDFKKHRFLTWVIKNVCI